MSDIIKAMGIEAIGNILNQNGSEALASPELWGGLGALFWSLVFFSLVKNWFEKGGSNRQLAGCLTMATIGALALVGGVGAGYEWPVVGYGLGASAIAVSLGYGFRLLRWMKEK